MAPTWTENATRYFFNKKTKRNEQFTTFKGLIITLTNNNTKGIMKVVNFLEKRGRLLEGTNKIIEKTK